MHVATDRGKFGDPGYQATVVRLETSTYTSPNNDNYDTVRVTGGPGKVYVRVSGASAARYDLAVWVLDSSTSDSSYDIELRYIGTQPSASQRSTFRAAADILERVISRSLSSRIIIDSDLNCEDGDPSLFGEYIDDLLIYVRLQRIDGAGGTVGEAGPCLRRSGSLPLVGDVSYGPAESYTLPSTTSSRLEAAGHEIHLGNDIRQGPVFVVDIPEQDVPVITP